VSYGIRLVRLEGIDLNPYDVRPHPGDWLSQYDPDAYEGRGAAVWTPDKTHALRFNIPADAMRRWRAQSTVRPWRRDGKPNRPLTAYTIEIVEINGGDAPSPIVRMMSATENL
jgi:hypothetical protein